MDGVGFEIGDIAMWTLDIDIAMSTLSLVYELTAWIELVILSAIIGTNILVPYL